MRLCIALIVVLPAAVLSSPFDQAQKPITPETISGQECTSPSEHQQEPSGPDISIAEVSFWGSPVISTSEQTEISRSIKQRIHGTVLTDVIDESSELVRWGWQDRGYFNVEVEVEETILPSGPGSQRLALHVQVVAGPQYRLGRMTFRNNRAVTNENTLRALFPIKDGDIFSRAKIAKGLETLRKAYGSTGYINYTSFPKAEFDDANNLITLNLDFDEGKQFRVTSITVLGLDETAKGKFLRGFPIKQGQIYNQNIWEKAFVKYQPNLPYCPCRLDTARHIDEKSGSADLAFDFRPCNTD